MTIKVNQIPDWTQAELDAQIALGNYPVGTLLADITLPSDWNELQTEFDNKVPYTGATSDVNLGTNDLITDTVRASTSAGLLIESNNGTDVALFGAGGGANGTIYGGLTVAGQLAVDTDTLFVDATNNRVGVGTSSPDSRIHAKDGSYAELKFNSGSLSLTPALAVGNTDPSGKFAGLVAGTAGSAFIYDSTGTFYILTQPKADYTANTLGAGSATTRMSITSAGIVNVAASTASTSTTTGALTVSGGLGVAGTIHAGAATLPVSSAGLNLYNTADQATNYEQATMQWNGNNLYIGTIRGGSATRRALRLTAGDTLGSGNRTELSMNRDSTTRFLFVASNQADNTAGLTVAAIGTVGGFTATSGTTTQLSLLPTFNQSGTAANTDFLINRTETALGSGSQKFADFQVGGVSKFNILNTGDTAIAGDAVSIGTALPTLTFQSTTTTSPYGMRWRSGSAVDAAITHQASTASMTISTGRSVAWGGDINFVVDTVSALTVNPTTTAVLQTTASTAYTNGALTVAGGVGIAGNTFIDGNVSHGAATSLKTFVSSAATLTIGNSATTYVFSGTTTTWTLPAVSGNTSKVFFMKNRGSGDITLNRAGADNIYDTAAVTSITITPGQSIMIQNDGTYWLVM